LGKPNPGGDGRIVLKWIFRKWDGRHGLDWSSSGKGQVAGTCECGNEPSGSIKYGELPNRSEPVSFSRRTLFHWGVSKRKKMKRSSSTLWPDRLSCPTCCLFKKHLGLIIRA
jgi:hypothetical protein